MVVLIGPHDAERQKPVRQLYVLSLQKLEEKIGIKKLTVLVAVGLVLLRPHQQVGDRCRVEGGREERPPPRQAPVRPPKLPVAVHALYQVSAGVRKGNYSSFMEPDTFSTPIAPKRFDDLIAFRNL